MPRSVIVLAVSVLVAACVATSPGSNEVTPRLTGVAGLVGDLSSAGFQVRQTGTIDASPMQGQAVVLCVDSEELRVYSFPTEQARIAAARTIDPNAPSHIGTTIVEWSGNPRFWQRDTIIALYLGTDARTEGLLMRVLGQPFAKGAAPAVGGPRLNSCRPA